MSVASRGAGREDFYSLLGVPREASPETIRKAYHRLARQYHPDTGSLNEDGTRGNPDLFDSVNKAYGTLSDPSSRAEYDRWLDANPVFPTAPSPTPRKPSSVGAWFVNSDSVPRFDRNPIRAVCVYRAPHLVKTVAVGAVFGLVAVLLRLWFADLTDWVPIIGGRFMQGSSPVTAGLVAGLGGALAVPARVWGTRNPRKWPVVVAAPLMFAFFEVFVFVFVLTGLFGAFKSFRKA